MLGSQKFKEEKIIVKLDLKKGIRSWPVTCVQKGQLDFEFWSKDSK